MAEIENCGRYVVKIEHYKQAGRQGRVFLGRSLNKLGLKMDFFEDLIILGLVLLWLWWLSK